MVVLMLALVLVAVAVVVVVAARAIPMAVKRVATDTHQQGPMLHQLEQLVCQARAIKLPNTFLSSLPSCMFMCIHAPFKCTHAPRPRTT